MHYLKRRRSQLILGSFVCCSLLITALPSIDIYISRLFFHGSAFQRELWQTLVHENLGLCLSLSLIAVIAIYAHDRLLKRSVCRVDGKRVLYLLLVLALGAGLIVNVGLKDNFGRARPRNIVEFGGTQQFTPAYLVSRECNTNCSFSSGDAAGGFFSLALAMALSRRRRTFVAAMGVGVLVSLARIASGAHFFSDTVVSFFVMLIVADVLYFYMVLTDAERDEVSVADDTLEPVYLSASAQIDAQIVRTEIDPR